MRQFSPWRPRPRPRSLHLHGRSRSLSSAGDRSRRRRSDAVRGCADPLYNTFESGGALIWFVPEKKVFIDNRQDPYSSELLAAAHQLESDGRFQSLFARYGIRCAIVPSGTPTAAALSRDADWSTVHADPRWAVFTPTLGAARAAAVVTRAGASWNRHRATSRNARQSTDG